MLFVNKRGALESDLSCQMEGVGGFKNLGGWPQISADCLYSRELLLIFYVNISVVSLSLNDLYCKYFKLAMKSWV